MGVLYFHYIIHFFILLFIGGIFCIGLFTSSRGETVTAPDGTKIDMWAMIFYPITKFLCKTKKKVVYFQKEYLSELYSQIKKDFPEQKIIYVNSECNMACVVSPKDVIQYWCSIQSKIEEKYLCKMSVDEHGYVKFWKEYEVNIFPSLLFKPVIGCYKCYASVWGTLIYILGTNFAISTGYIYSDQHILIPMWIVYCMSLVTVNCWMYKIVKD